MSVVAKPFKLFDYQLPATRHMVNTARGIVVMRPGRGKTAVAVGAIKILMNLGKIKGATVLTHKRGVEAYRKLTGGLPMVYADKPSDLAVLAREFEADPNRVFVVSTGLMNRFEAEWDPKHASAASGGDGDGDPMAGSSLYDGGDDPLATTTETTEATKEGRSTPASLYRDSILFRVVRSSGFTVVDEIHNYRKYTNSTSKYLLATLSGYRGRLQAMTATPFYSSLDDVYAVFSYLDPKLFGSYPSFQSKYCITSERQSQAYRWVMTSTGKRKVLMPTTFREVMGYKNQDQLMDIIKPYLYLDQGTEFEMDFHPVTYALKDTAAYLKVVRGEGLADCVRLTLAGDSSTFSALYGKGETIVVVGDERTSYEKLPGRESFEMDPADAAPGLVILREGPHGPMHCRVMSKAKDVTEADIISRLQKLTAYLSTTAEKQAALFKVLDAVEEGKGAVVFCQYLDTIAMLQERLEDRYPGRRVQTVTGGEDDMAGKLGDLGPTDFVLISRVALQSLDFYYDTLVIYESITNPGSFEQLIGRVTRLNAVFRKVDFHFIVGERSIDAYFYERLLYLISQNVFSTDVKIEHLDVKGFDFSDPSTTLKTLKAVLLWRQAYEDMPKEG